VEHVLIRPQLAPQGARDLNRSVLAGGFVLLQLLGLPVLVGSVVYLLAENGFWALLAGYAAFLLLALYVGLHAVGWLKLDSSGITFGRRLGTPKLLRWDQITEIRPATSAEVVRHGWLWPALRPREATRSLTSEGHYRIKWDQQFCFFPPADEHAFRAAVERWAPGVLSSAHSA
jgi:hypothetical protein